MSESVTKLLKAINLIAKDDDDELADAIKEYDEIDYLIKQVNAFEKDIYKLFKAQKKYYVDAAEGFVSKAELTDTKMMDFYNYMKQDLFAADEFAKAMGTRTATMLGDTIEVVTSKVMDMLDKDVSFNTLSGRTKAWIENWSEDLASLMQLNTHVALEAALTDVINEGKGIPDAVKVIKDLPGFTRDRARTTAITEILTANSASQQEAYMQSPAVTKKKWRHSGPKKIKPRKAHVELSGTEVDTEDAFNVNGYGGDYPRDPRLPAKERINCHCVLQPVVDRKILGLPAVDKEAIRAAAMKEFNYDKYKRPPA